MRLWSFHEIHRDRAEFDLHPSLRCNRLNAQPSGAPGHLAPQPIQIQIQSQIRMEDCSTLWNY